MPEPSDEGLWCGESFAPASLFAREAPLEVEVGSGKGRFLIEAGRANPTHDFLGLERSLAYYRICRDRIIRSALANVRVLRADGRLLLPTLRSGSVRAFHVYFPDPWPKKKQRKRRLLDGVSLELLARLLEPGGVLRIQTDHADYGAVVSPLLRTVAAFEPIEWDSLAPVPPTHYEMKYRAQGRPIWRFAVRRQSRDPHPGEGLTPPGDLVR